MMMTTMTIVTTASGLSAISGPYNLSNGLFPSTVTSKPNQNGTRVSTVLSIGMLRQNGKQNLTTNLHIQYATNSIGRKSLKAPSRSGGIERGSEARALFQ